jgi:hypothetical protein
MELASRLEALAVELARGQFPAIDAAESALLREAAAIVRAVEEAPVEKADQFGWVAGCVNTPHAMVRLVAVEGEGGAG